MNKNKVRWGILGTGVISHSFVKDFSCMQNAELNAVAASDAVWATQIQNATIY